MIVTCPQCNSRYRVREEKLPPGGGNIQCPACGRIFPAFPPPGMGIQPEATGVIDLAQIQTIAATSSSPAVEPARTDRRPAPVEEPTHVMAKKKVQRGEETPTSPTGPRPSATEQWKIRSPVGLVYDFPDLGALQTWLSTRESIDGMSASRDGGATWQLLTLFPELRGALPKAALSRATSAPPSSPADARTTALRPQAPRTPSAQGEAATAAPFGSAVASAPTVALVARGSTAPAESRSPTRPPLTSTDSAQSMRATRDSAAVPAAPSQRPGTGMQRPAQSGPRPSIRSGAYSAARPAAGARGGRPPATSGARRAASGRDVRGERPKPRKAGPATYVAILLLLGVLAVVTLQVLGVYDFYGALGLRQREADPVGEAPTAAPDSIETPTPADIQQPVSPQQTPSEAHEPLDLLEQRRQGLNPHAGRVLSLLNQGRRALDEGRIEDAITFGQNALQFDRDNADVVCFLSEAHRRGGSFEEADAYGEECDRLTSGSQAQTEGGGMER